MLHTLCCDRAYKTVSLTILDMHRSYPALDVAHVPSMLSNSIRAWPLVYTATGFTAPSIVSSQHTGLWNEIKRPESKNQR